ncbi:MAG: glycoside hydrolase family 15 protein [Deltaproteobacteria bacterium]|nr:glycoside hydrolase family 15 protein [Deltaproteobacteria bacterium]MBW2414653.1 glycoside hydrolase family 15 protein [Deltaproteobacteria bacterium]
MDIFSASSRLRTPFEFHAENRDGHFPISAHGVIGDGASCALVRTEGTIDWLCLPSFDSPSVFASLLDPAGGHTSMRPAALEFQTQQQYDPDTNVLETLFKVPGQGLMRLTDYMPWTDDPRASIHEVHRRVDCREGAVDLEVVFDPRFNYGADTPEMEYSEHGVLAVGGSGERLAAVLGDGARWESRPEGGARARLTLRSGERCWLVLSWGAPRPEPIAAYRPYEQLRATRHFWREWSRRLRYDGPWRHHVLRSALLLKLLIHARTGAMVASPTTSLPEWPGGDRNWDYRYTWTRDAALAVRAANLIGYASEARDFFHFIRDTLDRDAGLRVMYTIDGGSVPPERQLEHLAGFDGSGPVRIGNGARDQLQFDTAGALLDAAWVHEQFGGSLTLRAWRHLAQVVNAVERVWRKPDNGIWEIRSAIRHNVHSKLMSWVAFERASQLAPLFGAAREQEAWQRESAELRTELEGGGLDSTGSHFVSAYGGDEMDATLLLLPIHGFLPVEDPRIERTIESVREELGSGPYLYRYLSEDGVGGPEGAFILCGFWLAEVLALSGRLEEAQEVFFAHVESSNHLGLLAEEIDPASGQLLGNFPQAFSHLGLINAAARLDLGLRLRDEGSGKSPRLIPH